MSPDGGQRARELLTRHFQRSGGAEERWSGVDAGVGWRWGRVRGA